MKGFLLSSWMLFPLIALMIFATGQCEKNPLHNMLLNKLTVDRSGSSALSAQRQTLTSGLGNPQEAKRSVDDGERMTPRRSESGVQRGQVGNPLDDEVELKPLVRVKRQPCFLFLYFLSRLLTTTTTTTAATG